MSLTGRSGPLLADTSAMMQVAELAQEVVNSLTTPLTRGLTVVCGDNATAQAVAAKLPGVHAVSTSSGSLPAAKNLLFLGLQESQARTAVRLSHASRLPAP